MHQTPDLPVYYATCKWLAASLLMVYALGCNPTSRPPSAPATGNLPIDVSQTDNSLDASQPVGLDASQSSDAVDSLLRANHANDPSASDSEAAAKTQAKVVGLAPNGLAPNGLAPNGLAPDGLARESGLTWEQLQARVEGHRTTWARVIMLLPGGPETFDWIFDCDGRSLESQRDAKIETLYATLRRPDQEFLAWNEMLDHPMVQSGLFPNLRPGNDEQRDQIFRRYDSNQDRKVQQVELVEYLTRGLARRGTILIEEASRYRGKNRDQSMVFARLDADGSGALEPSELGNSVARLELLDLNADRCLSGLESQGVEEDATAYRRQRQISTEDLVVLCDRASPQRAVESILRHHGGRDGLDRTSAPMVSDWDQWDKNRDGTWDADELLAWTRRDPKVNVIANLNDDGVAAKREWLIERPRYRIKVRVQDPLSPSAQQRRLRLIASTLGITAETSKPIAELSSASLPGVTDFAPLDRDGDGQLSWKELDEGLAMVAALSSAQLRLRWVDPPDAWFTWLDRNWDGMVSETEWIGAADRLRQLPSAGESRSPESLPMQMEVYVIRQYRDEPASQNLQEVYSDTPVDANLPGWFAAMDTNGDRLVSRREFLGQKEDFERFDRNRDGFVDPQELEK